MASIIDIKIPKAIAAALRIPVNDPRRQQIRVLKKLLKKAVELQKLLEHAYPKRST